MLHWSEIALPLRKVVVVSYGQRDVHERFDAYSLSSLSLCSDLSNSFASMPIPEAFL